MYKRAGQICTREHGTVILTWPGPTMVAVSVSSPLLSAPVPCCYYYYSPLPLSSKHILGVTKKQPTTGASNQCPCVKGFSSFCSFFAESWALPNGQGHFYAFDQTSMSRNLGNTQGVSKKRYFWDFLSYFSSRCRILLFHMCFGIRISSPFHLAIQKVSSQNLNCPKNACADHTW